MSEQPTPDEKLKMLQDLQLLYVRGLITEQQLQDLHSAELGQYRYRPLLAVPVSICLPKCP